MATLPNMVTAFAETDGRERKTIEHIARLIRERGYIPNGKRGGGAPQMTTPAATNLTIALCGCDTPVEAPLAIDRFRSLRSTHISRDYTGNLKVLKLISECETFGEALEILIEGTLEIVLAVHQYIREAYETDNPETIDNLWKLGVAGAEVEFARYGAAIRVFHDRKLDFEERFICDVERMELSPSFYGLDRIPDRRVSVKIGLPTLLSAVKSILREDELES